MSVVILDTGALYAAADQDDAWHARMKSFFKNNKHPMVVPVTVLPEVCYLLGTYLGSKVEQSFVSSLVNRELKIEPLSDRDLARSAQLMGEFEDAAIGLVDASIAAMAERMNVSKIATTDRRHFSLFRPRHCKAFVLLP